MHKNRIPALLVLMMTAGLALAGAEDTGRTITGHVYVNGRTEAVPMQVQISALTDSTINGYSISRFEWEKDGEILEACIGGLDSPLTEEEAGLLAGGFNDGLVTEISGSGLVDAEKASTVLPVRLAEPVELTDEITAGNDGGDSSMCWAGSLSDMLQITGWGRKAVNPYTGNPFENEDELFSFLTAEFTNMGFYQAKGAQWFFNGEYEFDKHNAEPRHENSGGLLPEIQVPVTALVMRDYQGNHYLSESAALFAGIAEGGVIGLDVQLMDKSYMTLGDCPDMVDYDPVTDRYSVSDIICIMDLEAETVRKQYVPDEEGKAVFVRKTDGVYADEDGNTYESRRVLEAPFYEQDGCFYPVTTENYNVFDCAVPHSVDASEVDFSTEEYGVVSAHALTAVGYVHVKDRPEDIRGLVIIDTDNDARVWNPVGPEAIKENRPNRYTLYHAAVQPAQDEDEQDTLMMTDYCGKHGILTGVTLLQAAPAEK